MPTQYTWTQQQPLYCLLFCSSFFNVESHAAPIGNSICGEEEEYNEDDVEDGNKGEGYNEDDDEDNNYEEEDEEVKEKERRRRKEKMKNGLYHHQRSSGIPNFLIIRKFSL